MIPKKKNPLTKYPALDLRQFQGMLYRKQMAKRTSGLDQILAKMRDRKHASRVRQRACADLKVVDRNVDCMTLENGQRLSRHKTLRRSVGQLNPIFVLKFREAA